jgi:signal transduction histidine kinase
MPHSTEVGLSAAERGASLHPSLANLGPKSTLADLPLYDFQVPSATPGRQVAEAFKRRPDLPGVIVTGGAGALELISQANFFKLLSQPFCLEIYLGRPIELVVQALNVAPLRLGHGTDIAEAAQRALHRGPLWVYEPLLVEYPDGTARILDIHVLLLAQAQLLRVAQVALLQSEKLASLGQLAAGVAHEVNNPLAYVLNNVNVLRRDVQVLLQVLRTYRQCRDSLACADPETAAAVAQLEEEQDLAYLVPNLDRLFDRTQEGLHRVRDIVANLRDFARLDAADLAEADLNACLRSALELTGHEIKRRAVRVETQLQELPRFVCHSRKINQVFLNLLLNAIQSCGKEGGVVVLRTRLEGDEVVVEVEDNGSGIQPEHLPRIFDPFFTTKPIGEGTGLGLAVTYGIIREHGGSIQVESQPGRGSLFRARLPLRAPRVGRPAAQPASTAW